MSIYVWSRGEGFGTGGGDNNGCSFRSAHISLGTSIAAILMTDVGGEEIWCSVEDEG
jgi:hypothetical protein